MEENLYRIYTLRDLGYDPYVMVYDKPHAPKKLEICKDGVTIRLFSNRALNLKIMERCEDYDTKRKSIGLYGAIRLYHAA